ncbi:MAG TPA: hypothetical protein VJ867_10040 [Gemmatimonadaceae bacterium]|nr:hypothetical protein [Gemmatimonadaceae bacterium]
MGTALPTPSASRRWTGRLIRVGLVLFAIVFIGAWFGHKISRRTRHVQVQRQEVTDQALGPGDLRIYNIDSTVDLVLHADKVLAGLSPKTVAKVRDEMQRSADRDTSGIGGMIASTVKQTVASAITTHMVYPVSDIAELRFENGEIVMHRRDGSTTTMFGNAKVNGEDQSKSFRAEDAQRFIDAVDARKRQLGVR